VFGGFEPKRRMGEGENRGPTQHMEEEEGGLAAGKTHGRRRRAVSGGRAPRDPDREKQGRRRSR
jgi:hypothetical protein